MAESVVSRGKNMRLQRRAARSDGWTKKRRALFLDALAESCNVTASAQAAGMYVSNAYKLRRADPEFAELWREAIAIGYDRLEAELLAAATKAVNDIAIGETPATKVGGVDFDKAVRLLAAHRGSVVQGRSRACGGPRKRATREETDAALMKKLDALDRRKKAKRAHD